MTITKEEIAGEWCERFLGIGASSASSIREEKQQTSNSVIVRTLERSLVLVLFSTRVKNCYEWTPDAEKSNAKKLVTVVL